MSDIRWKDPNGIDDFPIDWQYDLPSGDTIASATWSISPTDMSIGGSTFTNTTTSVNLADGDPMKTYEVTCRIFTAGGVTRDRTLYVICRPQ